MGCAGCLGRAGLGQELMLLLFGSFGGGFRHNRIALTVIDGSEICLERVRELSI